MVWTAGALQVGGEPARGGDRPADRRRDGSGLAGVAVMGVGEGGHVFCDRGLVELVFDLDIA